MVDHRGRREAAIGAAQIVWDVAAFLRQALDVRLIDDGVFPRDLRADLAATPVEGLVDHDGLGYAAGIVAPVERQVLARATGAIGKMGVAPYHPPGKPPRIGIEQQLVGIESVAVLGLVGAMNAIAIELPGRNVVQIAMPYVLAALGQLDAFEFAAALAVEQAQFNLSRIGGKQREIGAPAVPARTEAGGCPGG